MGDIAATAVDIGARPLAETAASKKFYLEWGTDWRERDRGASKKVGYAGDVCDVTVTAKEGGRAGLNEGERPPGQVALAACNRVRAGSPQPRGGGSHGAEASVLTIGLRRPCIISRGHTRAADRAISRFR